MHAPLFPYFLSYALAGGILAADGALMDLLLRHFSWSPATFGLVMMLRGLCSAGGAWLGSRLVHHRDLRSLLQQSYGLIALGMGAFYFADLILPAAYVTPFRAAGAALVGLSFGLAAATNNMRALLSGNVHVSFAWLQMGFTAGATFSPFLIGPWREHAERLIAGGAAPDLWRAPLLGFLAAAFLLILATPYWDRRRPEIPAEAHAEPSDALAADPLSASSELPPSDVAKRRRSPRLPALLTAALLFCYVGVEINLSNGVLVFAQQSLAANPTTLRWTSAAFWCGLFASRLLSAIRPVPARAQAGRIVQLSLLTCLCIVLFLSGKSSVSTFATLASVCAMGLFLGAIYSLGIANVSLLYLPADARVRTHHVLTLSAFGSILLPPLFGFVWERLGIEAGMNLVLAIALAMLAVATLIARLPNAAQSAARAG